MIGDLACPHCGRVNEVHDGPTPGAVPSAGDVSLCWKCRMPAFYIEDGGLRAPTSVELEEIMSNPAVRAALAAMAESYTPAQANELRRGGHG
jgi:hypothetical protein